MKNNMKILFAVTENHEQTAAGDYYTAMELGTACQKSLGWQPEYLSYRPECQWYDHEKLKDADILIAMTHAFDPRKIEGQYPDLIRIAWLRNWFDQWSKLESFRLWDLRLCSSEYAASYIDSHTKSEQPEKTGPFAKTGSNSRSVYSGRTPVLRIATNHHRFAPVASFQNEAVKENAEQMNDAQDNAIQVDAVQVDVIQSCDICFTGNFWDVPRDIEKIDPSQIQGKIAIYGNGWENHPVLGPYHKGFARYSDLPEIYNRSRIVIDDANHVTKKWGSVNSRVYDALACGTLVITNSAKASEDAFRGKLPVYSDSSELSRMISLYLSNENLYNDTVHTLRSMVLENHTYEIRAHELRKIIEKELP